MSERLTDTVDFNATLGFFYGAWAVSDALMDCAIGRTLRLTHAETHIVTAGMPFGRKIALLRSLVNRGNHKNKQKIIQSINTIQNESLRNIFAHSYLASDEKTVSFIERSHSADYWAKETHFYHETVWQTRCEICSGNEGFGRCLGD